MQVCEINTNNKDMNLIIIYQPWEKSWCIHGRGSCFKFNKNIVEYDADTERLFGIKFISFSTLQKFIFLKINPNQAI